MGSISLWRIGLLLAMILVPEISRCSVNGYEAHESRGEIGKVKCKEHVEEALRQYWDHEKDGSEEDNVRIVQSQEDEDEDDDDRGDIKSDEEDDDKGGKDDEECSEEENKSGEDDDEDKSKENDDDHDDHDDEKEKDKDDDEDESKEKEESKLKDDDEDDNKSDEEEDDDKDLKHSKDKDAKQTIDKSKLKSSKDEDDSGEDNNDNDNDDDGEKDKKNDSEEEEEEATEQRSRSHIDDILRVNDIGSPEDIAEQNLILSIFRELKKLYETAIKPLELMYKYRHITTRLFTDAEIFSKPMVTFLGGKLTGKTSLVNYLLGLESTPWQLKTGLTTTSPHFNILSYGDNYSRVSPTELAADFAFSSLQQFGQHFLEQYIQSNRMPINILQKMTIIDSPGLIDLIAKGASSQQSKGIDSDVYQWFIDRSDVIYIIIDVNQLHLSQQLQTLIEQLKGRDVRFIINKSDIVSHSQIITLIGQLLWILSPIMPAERPPQVYALTTVPQDVYDAFLDDQEQLWLKDLSEQIGGLSRVESRIAALRRHAVRVRNHAKLIDCYLATYYKHKGIFTFGSSSRTLASDITENPHQYRIFSGAVAGQAHNISRYDLPDPGIYKEFFRSNSLIDFKPLSSTCSYFKGCPIDKLDLAIAYQLPELIGKYKKLTKTKPIV